MGYDQQTLVIDRTWNGHPIGSEERVTLILRPGADGVGVAVEAPFHGDPAPPGPAGATDGLWEHEVVELFFAGQAVPGRGVPYTELELSPHGHYLVLRLEGVRCPIARLLPLSYAATVAGDRWSGNAVLPWEYLPPGPLFANAYALHGVGEDRRYLAMTPVPGPVPDFHQPAVFRPLELAG